MEKLQAENKALADTFNERLDSADRELKQNNETLRADIAKCAPDKPPHPRQHACVMP